MPVIINIPSVVGDDTSDATATSSDMKSGVTAYVNGEKITGNAYTRGATTVVVDGTEHWLKDGFYGGITVPGDENLISKNIKAGTTIYGVSGDKNVVDTTINEKAASSSYIQSGRKGYVNGKLVTGAATTISTLNYTPTTANQTISGPAFIEKDTAITIQGDENLRAANIKKGTTIFGVEGTLETETTGIDTSDATATAADILSNKTAYVNGEKVTGTIETVEEAVWTPSAEDKQILSSGVYVGGTQTIQGEPNFLASNIRKGVDMWGVQGTYEAEGGGDSSHSEKVIFDCRSYTSSEEVMAAYSSKVKTSSNGFETFSDMALGDYQGLGAYYSNDLAGIGFNVGSVPAGFYFTDKITVEVSTLLMTIYYYVSSWVNPKVILHFVEGETEEEVQDNIKNGIYAYTENIAFNNSMVYKSTLHRLDNVPSGTYTVFFELAELPQGNADILSYVSFFGL